MPCEAVPPSYSSHYRLFGGRSSRNNAIVHKVCGGCGVLLSTSPCSDNNCRLAPESDVCFFELPIDLHIQDLFKSKIIIQFSVLHTLCLVIDPSFPSLITGRFTSATEAGHSSDIYDGEVYVSQSDGFLSVPTNISLTLNTDGVRVFHSSSYTLWPVFFSINELPATLRSAGNAVSIAAVQFDNFSVDSRDSIYFWQDYGVPSHSHPSSSLCNQYLNNVKE